jgi:hypothetical protein
VTEKLTRKEFEKVERIVEEAGLAKRCAYYGSEFITALKDHTESGDVTDVKLGDTVKINRASFVRTAYYVGQTGKVVNEYYDEDVRMVLVKHNTGIELWHDVDAVEIAGSAGSTEQERTVLQILRNAPKDLTAEGEKNLAQEIVRAYYGESSDTSDAGVNRGINAGSDGA